MGLQAAGVSLPKNGYIFLIGFPEDQSDRSQNPDLCRAHNLAERPKEPNDKGQLFWTFRIWRYFGFHPIAMALGGQLYAEFVVQFFARQTGQNHAGLRYADPSGVERLR